jgi:hypothetical protein
MSGKFRVSGEGIQAASFDGWQRSGELAFAAIWRKGWRVNRQTHWSDDKPMCISKNRQKVATSVTSLSGRHLSGNTTGNKPATDWQHGGRVAFRSPSGGGYAVSCKADGLNH